MLDDHTNENIPSGVIVSLRGTKITLKFRTATVDLRGPEAARALACALLEVADAFRPAPASTAAP